MKEGAAEPGTFDSRDLSPVDDMGKKIIKYITAKTESSFFSSPFPLTSPGRKKEAFFDSRLFRRDMLGSDGTPSTIAGATVDRKNTDTAPANGASDTSGVDKRKRKRKNAKIVGQFLVFFLSAFLIYSFADGYVLRLRSPRNCRHNDASATRRDSCCRRDTPVCFTRSASRSGSSHYQQECHRNLRCAAGGGR